MKILIALLLLVALTDHLLSQDLVPRVILHTDRLPLEEREFITGLDCTLVRLIREWDAVGGEKDLFVPVQIEIFFDKWGREGIYHRYSAGILVGFPWGAQFRDRRWEFYYDPYQRLPWGERYHPITGLLEFYLQLGLGVIMDQRALLGGDPYYLKAQMISQNARFEALYSLGWSERRELVSQLADTTLIPVRQAAYYEERGWQALRQEEEEEAVDYFTRAAELLLTSSAPNIIFRMGDHSIRWFELSRLLEGLDKLGLAQLYDQLSDRFSHEQGSPEQKN
ncbi:MAG: DUF4835 family protein [bacterium]